VQVAVALSLNIAALQALNLLQVAFASPLNTVFLQPFFLQVAVASSLNIAAKQANSSVH